MRERRGLTIKSAARELGVPQCYLRDVERGQTNRVEPGVLARCLAPLVQPVPFERGDLAGAVRLHPGREAAALRAGVQDPAADAARKRTVPLRRACPSGEPALIEPAPQQLDLIHAEP